MALIANAMMYGANGPQGSANTAGLTDPFVPVKPYEAGVLDSGVIPTQTDAAQPVTVVDAPLPTHHPYGFPEQPSAYQFQNPQFLDRLWSQVNNGGSTGLDQQKQMYARHQMALESNNFLPPGVSRGGLIAEARGRAPQDYTRPYIPTRDPNYMNNYQAQQTAQNQAVAQQAVHDMLH